MLEHVHNVFLSDVSSIRMLCSDRFGSQRTAEKIVPLNNTSSGNYTLILDQPMEVSGVEIIGIDIMCEATVTWNVSTRRG